MTNISLRKQKRIHLMAWAMLMQTAQPALSWMYLLDWARLGGKPDEVPTIDTEVKT